MLIFTDVTIRQQRFITPYLMQHTAVQSLKNATDNLYISVIYEIYIMLLNYRMHTCSNSSACIETIHIYNAYKYVVFQRIILIKLKYIFNIE